MTSWRQTVRVFNPLQSKGIKSLLEKGAEMGFSEEEKNKIMQQRAKEYLESNDYDTTSIRDDITDVVETTIGKGSASEDIIQNVLLTIENHYGEIDG